MSSDSERRVRNEIEGVFNAFSVPFEHNPHGKRPCYEFFIHSKRVIFPYAGGDPRAHLNARSDLRNLLRRAGYTEVFKEIVEEDPPTPQELVPVVTEPEPIATTQEEPVISFDELTTVDEVEDIAMDEMPAASTDKPPKLNIRSGYIYQSPRVLGIRLDRDLLVTAGNVLVIPLNKPNTVMEMSEEQFAALFDIVIENAPVEAPQAHLPRRPVMTPTRRPEEAIDVEPVSSIPAQIGRLLAAMAFARKVTGKDDIGLSAVSPHLDPRDLRQFSARMPSAIQRGLVERGLPYADRRGTHFKLTDKGYETIAQMGTWPWECEALPVPDWFAQR